MRGRGAFLTPVSPSGPLRTFPRSATKALMTGIERTGGIRGCVAISLVSTVMLSACDERSSSRQSPMAAAAGGRLMVGVLTLGAREGQSFQECPLDEPWNCSRSDAPECNFRSDGRASAVVGAAVAKAGLAGEGFGTFGVRLIGVRVEGAGYGHMSAYRCEVVAHDVRSIAEVPSVPPEP